MFNTFLIQEDISKGQRVESFTVEALIDGIWQQLGEGTTVGYKRLLRFPECKAEKIRVTVNGSRGIANISKVGLFYARPLTEEDAALKLMFL